MQSLKVEIYGTPLGNQTWHMKTKAFRTHTTALWPMEQSSFLSAKFHCPIAHQNLSLLAAAYDYQIGLYNYAP